MTTHVLLYAEDEESDIFFMRRAFSQLGVPVTMQTASTGPDTIAYLSGTGEYADRTKYPLPNAVMLDVNLPGCSGFDVLKWLREQPAYKGLYVIMFSSSARPEDLQKARDLGASDYKEKPGSGLEFSEIAEEMQRLWTNALPLPPSLRHSGNPSMP